MLFRQLIDAPTGTHRYLLADEKSSSAVLIDSVFEQHLRDLALIRELDLKLLYTLDTHVHADHVTGAWLMKEALGSMIAIAKASGAEESDMLLEHGAQIAFGGLSLEARATPGHTNGCLTYVLPDESMAFTGDALLIRGAGRTDFQEGDPHTLFKSVREQILSLQGDCSLYPGHDYSGRCATTVTEERRHNPRLGDQVREEDFVGYMNNLGLPHPNRIDEAVPANLRCGKPTDDSSFPGTPDWGPVIRTFAGVWQIEPEWVFKNQSEVSIIDVREHEEIKASPMGRLPGSAVIPLSVLRDRIHEASNAKPLVFVCPAGARSAIAATIFEKEGFERVANLRGGILEWRSIGLPVEL